MSTPVQSHVPTKLQNQCHVKSRLGQSGADIKRKVFQILPMP